MKNNKTKFGKVLICLAALIIALSFVVVFFVRDAAIDDKVGTVDVILFAGQSNMVGYGEEPSSFKIKHGEAYEYLSRSNELIDVKDPIGEREGIDANKALKGSMIPSYIYYYLKNTDHKVIAVPSAFGATSIDVWQPGGNCLTSTIAKYNNAIRYIEKNTGYHIDKKIYVWLQGETDILLKVPKEEYEEKYLIMNDELMASTGISEGILIPIGSRRDAPLENAYEINKAQYELIEKDDRILMGSESAFKFSLDKTMLKSDVLHFNTKALEILGKESALNYFAGKG